MSRLLFPLISRISAHNSRKLHQSSIRNVLSARNGRNFASAAAKLPHQHFADFEEVKLAKNDQEIYLIDVREPSELQETGCIPGSINVPLAELESVLKDMSDENFQKCYKRQKPDKDSALIFSCKIGKRSGIAQEIALKLGFSNVKNYLGSWQEWEEKINK